MEKRTKSRLAMLGILVAAGLLAIGTGMALGAENIISGTEGNVRAVMNGSHVKIYEDDREIHNFTLPDGQNYTNYTWESSGDKIELHEADDDMEELNETHEAEESHESENELNETQEHENELEEHEGLNETHDGLNETHGNELEDSEEHELNELNHTGESDINESQENGNQAGELSWLNETHEQDDDTVELSVQGNETHEGYSDASDILQRED